MPTKEKKPAARKPAAKKATPARRTAKKRSADQPLIAPTPLERILAQLDDKVTERGQAEQAELDLTEEIARLASDARKHGAQMTELARRIKRLNRKTLELESVTRQAVDTMLATYEQRREPRTTRASRRRRDSNGTPPAGTLNMDALA